ncbi:carboxypeptidase regulatory-like domain-containing protein [Silvibacterium sp.]|uniref:TonB-dependent receptor n=1 Tax=Silvibacterium sp. TaxID=1964179 RepID=UPI0039E50357
MSRRTSFLRQFHLFFAAIVLWSLPSAAQTFRGGISGSVTDNTGAAVPNVGVKATADATGLTHSTVSSGAGEYGFQDLPLGGYTIQVEASGFQTLVVKGVSVNAGVILALPLKLSVSTVNTTVQVSASALSLDSASSVNNSVIAGKSLQDLPLDSRDFKKVVGFVPGFGGYSGVLGSVNGARSNQTNWQIDGTDNNDLWANNSAINQSGIGGIAGTMIPIDAIDQFSLQTQSNAETGRNPGATANLIIKSGTNELHGSGYYFLRNEALAASPVFVPKRELRNENFGYSLGGPIVRNKTFFFSAFERQQFTIALSGLATEPSTAYQGQAESLLAANGLSVNPVSTALIGALYPAYALTGPASANNYISPDPETGYSNNGIVKLDHSFNDRNTISARWAIGQGNQIAPVGSNLKNFYEVAPIHVQNYSVVYNRIFSPKLVNQILLGVSTYNQVFHDFDTNIDVIALGLNTGASHSGAPSINISGFDGTGETPPEGRNDVTGHITDALSYDIGKHQFRFGGEYRRAQLDEFYFRNSLGTFAFDGSQGVDHTGYANNPNGYGSTVKALADFLAGEVDTSSFAKGNAERLIYVNTYDLFAQDAWQITPRLNVNYGLRYDYVGPLYNNDDNLPTFIPATATGLSVLGEGLDTLYPQDRNNFGPRFGFAYQPRENGSLVLRGSFGVYYDASSLSPFFDNRPSNGGPNGFEGNPAGTSPVQTFTPSGYTIVSGQPIFDTGAASIVGIFSVDPRFRTPYTYNYQLGIQQSLGSRAVLSIGYVGSESRKEITLADINQTPLNATSTTPVQSTRPYYSEYPDYGVINQVESNGNGNYNSLQSTLRTSNFHGLSTVVNYTWSHNLDDMTVYRSRLPQNSRNLKGDYGNSDYDTRNNFNAAAFYTLPRLGHGRDWISSGWEINAAATFRGGLPFNIATSSDNSGTGEKYQRPNLVGNPHAGITHSITSSGVPWINPAAFAQPAAGTYGDLRRNQIFGPGYGDIDLSVFKNTKLWDRLTLQLRAEMFNLYNRNNYAQPGGTFGSSSFGIVSDTIGDSNGSPGIGPGEPFNTQIAAKILF